MKSCILPVLLTIFIVGGCASTTEQYDGFLTAHDACYAYIYGENGVSKNYEKAFNWCDDAAQLGADSSQTLLAELYLEGNGVEQDLNMAGELFTKAALQGHPHAQMMVFAVYNIYLESESTAEEKATGLVFLRESVKSGYPNAQKVFNQLYGQDTI